MNELGDILERESRDVDLAPGAFERLLRRRDRKHRTRRVATVAVALVIAIPAIGVAIRAVGGLEANKREEVADTPGTWVITSDTTLTTDHHGSIVIGADGVTLDCAGFDVIGPSSDPSVEDGILVVSRARVTIRNCTINGFVHGIALDSSMSTDVVANTVTASADFGFLIVDSFHDSLTGNTATGNAGGFLVRNSHRNTISMNVASRNDGQGIDVSSDSSYNKFTENIVTQNAGNGFRIYDGTDHNLFDSNQANRNTQTGIVMYGGVVDGEQLAPPTDNTVSNNVTNMNHYGGLYLITGSTSNLVIGNQAFRNGEWGFALARAIDNTVRGNTACRNASWDAYQDDGSGNRWVQNDLCTSNT